MNDLLNKKLTINEIFHSIQGESYLSGLPFVFVRLTGCHQRCTYCDTEYAFYEGKKLSFEIILDQIQSFKCENVLITGGEPLLQCNTPDLIQLLLDTGYQVSVETSGNLSLENLPDKVVKIMDLKTPGSGECDKNNWNNIKFLGNKDEVKFVVTDEDDIDWAIATIKEYRLDTICHVSISPTDLELNTSIAEKILESSLAIRQQVQLHKLIWPNENRGI
jgi:7-carboxy-7-deazaguanine synthase